MGKSFKEVLDCVVEIIRQFCFAGADITDDEIASTKLNELNLPNDPHMPGISPLEALIIKVKSCACDDVELSADDINNNPNWTVKNLAQFIFGQCDTEEGWES